MSSLTEPRLVEEQTQLHREQARFLASRALYKGFVGGRGAGKTWVGAEDLVANAIPDRTYLVASPTGVLLLDTTYPTFKARAKAHGVWNDLGVRLSPYPTVTL